MRCVPRYGAQPSTLALASTSLTAETVTQNLAEGSWVLRGRQGSPRQPSPWSGTCSRSCLPVHSIPAQQCLSQRAPYTKPLKHSPQSHGGGSGAKLCSAADLIHLGRTPADLPQSNPTVSHPAPSMTSSGSGTVPACSPSHQHLLPIPLSTRASFSLCWPAVFPGQGLQRDRVGAERTGPEHPRGSTNKGPQPNSNSI